MKDFFAVDGMFATIANFIGEWMVLSILWVLTSLPIVTAGTAATAAYETAVTVIRQKEGHVASSFFRNFCRVFKRSLVFNLIYLVLSAVIAIDSYFFYANRVVFETNIYQYILLFAALFLLANTIYLYPCISRYTIKKRSLWKLSVVMQFRYFPVTFLGVIMIIVCLASTYFQPWSLVILPGMLLYLFSFPMEWVLKHYVADSDVTPESQA